MMESLLNLSMNEGAEFQLYSIFAISPVTLKVIWQKFDNYFTEVLPIFNFRAITALGCIVAGFFPCV